MKIRAGLRSGKVSFQEPSDAIWAPRGEIKSICMELTACGGDPDRGAALPLTGAEIFYPLRHDRVRVQQHDNRLPTDGDVCQSVYDVQPGGTNDSLNTSSSLCADYTF